MKNVLLLLSALAIHGVLTANQQTAIVSIDGEEHQVILGADQKISIGKKTHTINIKLSEQSLFENADVAFSYISNMTYTEDNSDPNFPMWNFDGDTCVIMVQRFQDRISSELLADSMKEEFENIQAKVTTKKSVLKYHDAELTGFRLSVSLGELYLSQEVYTKTINGRTIGLILQDTLNDDKSHSTEYNDSLQLLTDTLSFK